MNIKLKKPLTLQEAVTSSEVLIDSVVEGYQAKTLSVKLLIGYINGEAQYIDVLLFEKEEYEALGQWTDDVLQQRIIEILNEK
jgi:hypothetical protein